jgi:xanthine dehydrogenase accessory factor
MKTSFSIPFVLAGVLSAFGCAGGQAAPETAAKVNSNVKPIGEAKIGDTTVCPVSGEEFQVTATSPKVEHEGKTYFFCCAGCDKKFQAEPKKFLKKS